MLFVEDEFMGRLTRVGDSMPVELSAVKPVVAATFADNEFSAEVAMGLMAVEESGIEFPVDFGKAWGWLGYSTKQKCLHELKNNFVDGSDYRRQVVTPENPAVLSAQAEHYSLTVDCFKCLGLMAGTSKGREIRQHFLDCEKQAKQAHLTITELLRQLEEGRKPDRKRILPARTEKLIAASGSGDVAELHKLSCQEFPDLASSTLPEVQRRQNLSEMQQWAARNRG